MRTWVLVWFRTVAKQFWDTWCRGKASKSNKKKTRRGWKKKMKMLIIKSPKSLWRLTLVNLSSHSYIFFSSFHSTSTRTPIPLLKNMFTQFRLRFSMLRVRCRWTNGEEKRKTHFYIYFCILMFNFIYIFACWILVKYIEIPFKCASPIWKKKRINEQGNFHVWFIGFCSHIRNYYTLHSAHKQWSLFRW